MSAPGAGTRYASLGHWRGFAALWVLSFHTLNVWIVRRPDLLPGPMAWFFMHGWLGAHLFFVISGYCIAERCARAFRVSGGAFSFFVDRFLRIYPPYWVALGGAIALNVAGNLATGTSFATRNPLPGGWSGWLHALGAVEHWSGGPGYLLVAWTLSFEVGFYLLAALCLRLASWTGRPWTGWLLAGVLTGVGLSPAGSLLPLLSLWPHFTLGAAVWLLLRHVSRVGPRLATAAVIFLGVGLAGRQFTPWDGTTLPFVLLCAVLLLVLHPFDAKIVAARPLAWLGWTGTFSYSIYLVHAPIVSKVRNLLTRKFPPEGTLSLWVPWVACGLAVAVSWWFYQAVELRTERWRRAYARRQSAV